MQMSIDYSLLKQLTVYQQKSTKALRHHTKHFNKISYCKRRKEVIFQQSTDLGKLHQAEMILKGLINFSNSTEFRAGSLNNGISGSLLSRVAGQI